MTRLTLFLCLILASTDAISKSYDLIVANGYSFLVSEPDQTGKKIFYLFDLGTDQFVPGRELIDEYGLKHEQQFTIPIDGPFANVKIDTTIASPLRDSIFHIMFDSIMNGHLFGGIIGNTVFRTNYLIIDYQNNTLEINISSKKITLPEEVKIAPITWSLDQMFLKCTLRKNVTGYFHFDNGIPSYSVLEYASAKKARLDSLKEVPNSSSELVEDFVYDDEGNPVQKISRVVTKTNHHQPAICNPFLIGEINLGSQSFETMDTDMESDVFPGSELKDIIGSIGYESMKGFRIHIDLKESWIGFEK